MPQLITNGSSHEHANSADSLKRDKRKKKKKRDKFSVRDVSASSICALEQVASSFDISSCVDSVSSIEKSKRKRKRLKISGTGSYSCDFSLDENSSELEKRSLLAWVETSMEPHAIGSAIKDCGFGRGCHLKHDTPTKHSSIHAQTTSYNGNGMPFLGSVQHNLMDKIDIGSHRKENFAIGHSLSESNVERESVDKDTFLENGNAGNPIKEYTSAVTERAASSAKNKRKRGDDKVLDYVLKRSIVVHPQKNIALDTRTTQTHVHAWGKSITVTVTSESLVIEEWISNHNGKLFGLDVEWRPNRMKGRTNKVALLQLSNENECLIVQMLFLDRQPQALQELLSDPSKGLAGVGVHADGQKLLQDYGLECQGTIELTSLAVERLKRDELRNVGLKVLVKEVLGLALEKSKQITLSNWARPKLDRAQIIYACMDAWASFALSKRLL